MLKHVSKYTKYHKVRNTRPSRYGIPDQPGIRRRDELAHPHNTWDSGFDVSVSGDRANYDRKISIAQQCRSCGNGVVQRSCDAPTAVYYTDRKEEDSIVELIFFYKNYGLQPVDGR